MVWTIVGTIALVTATVAGSLVAGLSTGLFEWLFARSLENKGSDDPVYKKNLQRLIERNRQFEEERNERHS